MSKYSVNSEELLTAYNKLQEVLSNLQTASNHVNSAYFKLNNLSGKVITNNREAIIRQGREYDNQWNNVKIIAGYLQVVIEESEKAEQTAKQVLNKDYELTSDMLADGIWYACEKPQEAEEGLFTTDNGIKLVQGVVGKGLGIPGKAVASVWKALDDSSGMNVLKQGNKIVNAVAAEVVKKGTKTTKETLPFWKNISKNLKDEVSEYGRKTFENSTQQVAEGIRCATKWTEVAIDGVLNFADNISEFEGDLSNGRIYEETVVETVLSVGMDAVVKSVIGSAVVGLGGPGVVVAVAASMVVDYGLDRISEAICGNDDGWVENASDAIINIAHGASEAIGNIGKEAASMVGNGIATFGKTIMTLWA